MPKSTEPPWQADRRVHNLLSPDETLGTYGIPTLIIAHIIVGNEVAG